MRRIPTLFLWILLITSSFMVNAADALVEMPLEAVMEHMIAVEEAMPFGPFIEHMKAADEKISDDENVQIDADDARNTMEMRDISPEKNRDASDISTVTMKNGTVFLLGVYVSTQKYDGHERLAAKDGTHDSGATYESFKPKQRYELGAVFNIDKVVVTRDQMIYGKIKGTEDWVKLGKSGEYPQDYVRKATTGEREKEKERERIEQVLKDTYVPGKYMYNVENVKGLEAQAWDERSLRFKSFSPETYYTYGHIFNVDLTKTFQGAIFGHVHGQQHWVKMTAADQVFVRKATEDEIREEEAKQRIAKEKILKEQPSEDNVCSICTNNIVKGEEFVTICSNNHEFHSDCFNSLIAMHLGQHDSIFHCPNCREELLVAKIFPVNKESVSLEKVDVEFLKNALKNKSEGTDKLIEVLTTDYKTAAKIIEMEQAKEVAPTLATQKSFERY